MEGLKTLKFLTQNDEDVLLFSNHTSSMKHHLTERHEHNFEIQNIVLSSQSNCLKGHIWTGVANRFASFMSGSVRVIWNRKSHHELMLTFILSLCVQQTWGDNIETNYDYNYDYFQSSDYDYIPCVTITIKLWLHQNNYNKQKLYWKICNCKKDFFISMG